MLNKKSTTTNSGVDPKSRASLLLASLCSPAAAVKKPPPASAKNTEQPPPNFDKYKDHVVSDKSIADCVEAIIGAYLIESGPHAALQIMSWFGLEVKLHLCYTEKTFTVIIFSCVFNENV